MAHQTPGPADRGSAGSTWPAAYVTPESLYSEESERAVLGAVLIEATIPEAASTLRPEDFYFERHRQVWTAAVELTGEGLPVDLRTLQARLERDSVLDACGGVSYLVVLDADLPHLSRLPVYVDIIATRSGRRQRLDLLRRAHEAESAGRDGSKLLAEAATLASSAKRGGLRLVSAASLPMTRPVWIWRHRLPVGGVALLAGREGDGKTTLTVAVIAGATCGGLDGDRAGQPGHVVYVGIEDDWQSVMLPRLVAAGADLSRVHFVALDGGGVFSVERDLDGLASAVAKLGDVALVVVDPLDAHLGDDVDTHRKSEVQRAVSRLAELAALAHGRLESGSLAPRPSSSSE